MYKFLSMEILILSFIFVFIYFIVCVNILSAISMCTMCMPGTCGGQKKVLEHPETGVIDSFVTITFVLGTKPGYSARVTITLKS